MTWINLLRAVVLVLSLTNVMQAYQGYHLRAALTSDFVALQAANGALDTSIQQLLLDKVQLEHATVQMDKCTAYLAAEQAR